MYMKVASIEDIYHKNRNNLVGIKWKWHGIRVYGVFLKCMHKGFLRIIKFL